MSKAEELARQLSDMTSAFKAPSHGRGVLNGAIEELRRLAQVERELEALRASIGEPVAWSVFDGEGGYDFIAYDMNEEYKKDYAERNPRHADWVQPLYAIKDVK